MAIYIVCAQSDLPSVVLRVVEGAYVLMNRLITFLHGVCTLQMALDGFVVGRPVKMLPNSTVLEKVVPLDLFLLNATEKLIARRRIEYGAI